ncbi:MAG: tRNA preQ1(34) S-adenosylmethionine ribosyltransferase-isomerase QueA [Anaerovoracaceae bacterium]|nr:tRNA preQ1(34) S-adenosylmethionine ribosyltransferase-isomerase QueA [Bacillota bacterium]MDY2671425.1 tRNA preQ1(34) S-adenosylmethionine ribosyltransferase-isomerase QueA [Anaerovoracaceae bacterium]
MQLTDFDYDLPEELIAQYPSQKRDEARLLVVDREHDAIEHKKFYDIIDYLNPGDVLVMNDSKVIPARLLGTKEETGGKVEFLLTKHLDGDQWEAMVRPGRKLKPGARVVFSDEPGASLKAEVVGYRADGTRTVEFTYDGNFHDRLEQTGHIPLPPYINRPDEPLDRKMYQTVYSREEGSVAAPTAGLHFTDELLERIKEKGIKIAYVTLHVGIGTFKPVTTERIEDHHMHFEEYEVSAECAEMVNSAKAAGGRVISVGTTSTRTLESAADEKGILHAGSGSTGIFIYPGYTFKIVDALITNFHLPKSTLLMLISALYDREKILDIYRTAVDMKYRFFSYGDAMFIY